MVNRCRCRSKRLNKVYLVIEKGVISTLDEEYIRRGLAHAAEQAARGDEADWNVERNQGCGSCSCSHDESNNLERWHDSGGHRCPESISLQSGSTLLKIICPSPIGSCE